MTAAALPTRGYFAIPRLDEDLFGHIEEEQLCRRGAWLWLFENAVWRDTEKWIGRAAVKLHRGELACSYRYLSRAWGWTHGRVQRWLALLAQRAKIELRQAGGQIVIRLVDYGPERVTHEPPRESPKPAQTLAHQGGRESPVNQQPSQRRIQKQEEKDSNLGDGGGRVAPSEEETARRDALVSRTLAQLRNLSGDPAHKFKRVMDPDAYAAATRENKFKRWLRGDPGQNNGGLYAFACETLPNGPHLWAIHAAISEAFTAGSRAATPPATMKALDDLDRLYRQKTAGSPARRAWGRAREAMRTRSVAEAQL